MAPAPYPSTTAKNIITQIFGEKLIPTRPATVKRIETKVTVGVPNLRISLPAKKLAPPEHTPVTML